MTTQEATTFDYIDFHDGGDQAADLQQGLTLESEHRLRIRVHYDSSYDFQSHADAAVWHPIDLEWRETVRLQPWDVGAGHRGRSDRKYVCEQAAATLLARSRALLGLDETETF